jgi:hypothetical protein
MRAESWRLTAIILASWKAEIARVEVQDQSGQIIHQTPFQK